MSKIEVQCFGCGFIVQKERGEVNRAVRLGRNLFCSRSCSASYGNRIHPVRGSVDHLVAGNLIDDLSPFRYFAARTRARARDHRCHSVTCNKVTAEYLRAVWDRQEGKCIFTGWNLVLPISTSGFEDPYRPDNASLDRLDNGMGYLPGNVRFICRLANMARNRWSDLQLVEFCEAVVANLPD